MVQDNLKTILIVDDEEDLRDALCFDFKRQGYNVLQAENGRVAYQLVKDNPVAIVLSDVRMAGGDGVELLKNIKETHPEIPLILSTGFAEIGIDEAYAMGAAAVILKPFERKFLKELVQKNLSPFSVRVTEQREDAPLIDAEIVLTETNSETAMSFGSLGISFWWDSGKIKDKMNIKIHFRGNEFGDLLLVCNVKYTSVEDQVRKKQRIGAEVTSVQGANAEKFASWIHNSNFISSIPR